MRVHVFLDPGLDAVVFPPIASTLCIHEHVKDQGCNYSSLVSRRTEKIDIQSFSLIIEFKSWKKRIKVLYVDFSFTVFRLEEKGKPGLDLKKKIFRPEPGSVGARSALVTVIKVSTR